MTEKQAQPAASADEIGAWRVTELVRRNDDGLVFMFAGDHHPPLWLSRELAEHMAKVAHAETRPTNVIEALTRCIRDMPAIGKDQTMGSREGGGQSYQYRSIEAVTSNASVLFGRYCVLVKPHKIKRSVREITMGTRGAIWTEDELRVKYRVYGPGGVADYIDTAYFHALARDNSDKGTNKAMTQAFKQCLLQLLVVGDNKDDPDSYSPTDGSQPTREHHQPLSVEQWSLANGWDSNEQRLQHGSHARRAIKAEKDAGRLDPGGADGLWEDYKNPTGQGESPRSWTEHEQWMRANLPGHPVSPAAQVAQEAPVPAPARSPEPAATTGETGQQAGQAAESGQEPTDAAEARAWASTDSTADTWSSAGYTAEDGAPFEPAPAAEPQPQPDSNPQPDVEPAPAEDNGYRDQLDVILAERGVDGMNEAIRGMDVTAVVDGLRRRGVPTVGSHSMESLRRDLGAILIRNGHTPPPPPTTRARRR